MLNIILLFTHFVFAAPTINFDGSYSKACKSESAVSSTEYLQVAGESWSRTSQVYIDGNCQTPMVQTTYSYKVAQIFQMIDMTVLKIQMTVMTDAVAQRFNQLGYCGFTDWTAMQGKEVTGAQCGHDVMPAEGSVIYSILYGDKEPARKGHIYLGIPNEAADGSTEFKRYYEVDPSPFVED